MTERKGIALGSSLPTVIAGVATSIGLGLLLQKRWTQTRRHAAKVPQPTHCSAKKKPATLNNTFFMGRRPVFLLAALEISVASLGASVAPNYWILVLMIFLVGVGVGGLTVPFDILAEFLPSQGRGHNLLMIQYFWTIGCLYVVLTAFTTLRAGQDHWRGFVALCALPCLASFVFGYLYVPESARTTRVRYA